MDERFVPTSAFIEQINNYKTNKDKHVHLMCDVGFSCSKLILLLPLHILRLDLIFIILEII